MQISISGGPVTGVILARISLIALLGCVSFFTCHAQVTQESACFLPRSPSTADGFVLQTYFDPMLGQEVGAFVRYGKNEKVIPLVFNGEIEQEDPGLHNFKRQWLEVTRGKISGVYTLVRTGAGNKQGSYMVYKNVQTNKSAYFNRFADTRTCDEWHDGLK